MPSIDLITEHAQASKSLTEFNSPISVTSPLLNNSSLHKKAQQMIKRKASLYGLEQLSNPSLYDKNNLLTTFIPSIQRSHVRVMSDAITPSSSKHLRSIQTKKLLQQQTPNTPTRDKIFSIPSISLPETSTKKPKLFPELNKLQNLVHNQKQILHIFKQKLDNDINDIVFQYLKILSLSIKKQSQLHCKSLSPNTSILIPTLQFVCESLFECQFDKISLVLSLIAVNLCQCYKLYERIGKFLFLIAKVLRKMGRFQESMIVLKKALEYVWYGRRGRIDQKDSNGVNDKLGQIQSQIRVKLSQKQLPNIPHSSTTHQNIYFTTQLQIYNQLSYCLLLLNQKQQSHIFAIKYQIGYLQKQHSSSVLSLSRQLITSAQKRVSSWQRVNEEKIYLMIGCDLEKYLQVNGKQIMKKFNQTTLLNDLKANIQLMIQNLLKKDMFFYDIPLVTEISNPGTQDYKKSHPTSHNRKVLQQKFVYNSRRKSTHNRSNSIPVKGSNNNERVGENRILNYRGVGLSRTKLVDLLKAYIKMINKRAEEWSKQVQGMKLPQLSYDKRDYSKKVSIVEDSMMAKSNNSKKKTTIVETRVN